jgi:hypothetical protein
MRLTFYLSYNYCSNAINLKKFEYHALLQRMLIFEHFIHDPF